MFDLIFAAKVETRILCVQVRRRPIRDGLNAVLGGVFTFYFWCLKCRSDLTVLTEDCRNINLRRLAC